MVSHLTFVARDAGRDPVKHKLGLESVDASRSKRLATRPKGQLAVVAQLAEHNVADSGALGSASAASAWLVGGTSRSGGLWSEELISEFFRWSEWSHPAGSAGNGPLSAFSNAWEITAVTRGPDAWRVFRVIPMP